jgi:hypothetical protein
MKIASLNSVLRISRVIGLAVCMTLSSPGRAQQATSAATAQDDTNQQLLRRIDQLEAKVKQMEEKQAAAVPAPVPVAAAVPTPEPAPEMPTVNEVAPRLKLAVFGDVGYQVFDHIPNTFEFGSMDLFMRARLSDKVSVLGEVLFIAQTDNNIQADVERLYLQYRQNDYLTATIGRYHNWIGYYNTAFNKGEFLETTTDRPFIFQFDDTGGVLPMQEVGINLTGKIPSGKLGLHYVVEAGNGRGWGPTAQPAQNNQDPNNSKQINGGLYIRPDWISGLQMGFSVSHDNLTVPGPAVHEMIATVHAVFVNSKYELLNEAVLVRHVEPANGSVFETSAFYTQFSRAFRAFRPYFRYQYFNAPSDDPVYQFASPNDYAPLNVTTFVGRLNGPSVGIRYDFSEHSAFKVQYDRFDLRGLDVENGLTTQIAFTF